MIRYTVVWMPDAENRLADLWNNAADQQALADAANAIDGELAVNANEKGATVHEGIRALVVFPLRVLFVVEEPDRLVRVILVRRVEMDPKPTEGNGHVL